MNMKTENYLPIVNALEVLMKRALDLKIKKEDPYGLMKTIKLSGIRIAYLKDDDYLLQYLNAVPGRVEVYKHAPEMLITLFFKGKEKFVNYSFSMKNSFLSTYEGILTSGWPKLASSISKVLDKFYKCKRKDNKKYLEYQVKTPPYMGDEAFELPELDKIPKDFDIKFQGILKDYYMTGCMVQLDAIIKSSRKVWIVLDSNGTRIIQKQDIVGLSVSPRVIDEKKRDYDETFSRMARSFDELEKEFPAIKSEMQEFLYSINRKQLESGIYPLIFDYSAVATLFHEAIAGHMLSALYIVNEISAIFKGKLGKSVASIMPILKKLEIWDNPLDSSMVANYKYDMEGVPAKDVLLIDRGVVKNFLNDRYSAARMKKEGNGHALAEDFQKENQIDTLVIMKSCLPEPRVSNLKVLSDSEITFKQLEEKFFEEFGYYFHVKSYAGQVDVNTGTFELYVESLVKVYPDDTKEYFHGGTFSANLTDFIGAIQEVSNEYGFSYGYCGAGSGMVPTHGYTPAMSVYGINWAPDALPQKLEEYDINRDKYIPQEWVQNEKYEF